MKSHTEYITFHTKKHREMVRITDRVAAACKQSGIAEGFMLVAATHITACVFINDDESGLHQDIEEWVQKLAPEGVDTTAPARTTATRTSRICSSATR